MDGDPLADVARWDGSSWRSWDLGEVSSIEDYIYYKNDLYILSNSSIYKFNGNGVEKVNVLFDSNIGQVRLNIMNVYNSRFIVGGEFDSVNSIEVKNVVKWDGVTWSAMGEGFSENVNKFLVYKGELYVNIFFFIENVIIIFVKWITE